MAPSDSTKVALGVLALAGVGLALYLLSKQLRKKKKINDDTSSTAGDLKSSVPQDVSPLSTERQVPPDRGKDSDTESTPPTTSSTDKLEDTVPKSLWETHSVFQRKTQESELLSSNAPEDDGKTAKANMSGSVNRSESVTSTESTPISASMASWEDVQPMSASFVEVKSASNGLAESQSAGGDMVTSLMRPESLGSFTPLSFDKEFTDQASQQDFREEESVSGNGGLVAESKQQPQISGEDTVPSATCRDSPKESLTDDIQSLQSDASNGEVQSFEHINSSDEATSLAGSNGVDAGDNGPDIFFQHPGSQQLMDSTQSFEQVGVESSSLKVGGDGESLPSFEQISEPDGAMSASMFQSTMAEIPEYSQESASESKDSSQSEDNPKDTPRVEVRAAEEADVEKEQPSKRWSTLSEGDSSEMAGSFEMIKKGLGGNNEQFYSSESLQSFATATSGASGMQDFYSPISSPTPGGSSADNLSFKSLDDSADLETSEEMTFYDLESSGRTSTPPSSPQDRTPTNTPISPELSGGDAESAKAPNSETLSSRMSESLIIDDDTLGQNQGAGDPSTTKSSASSGLSKPATRPENRMLNIDKDKMAEAIMQAQTHPDRLEISHLQILVELLKQDDWTLLNTAVECIIRASAFTINVNIVTVCEGPKELARLLEKFATLLLSGATPASEGQSEGAPSIKILFLNIARAVNNLAMDIKSQAQLEPTIPMLTDLLMTEGISESVTLASLQPLTNLSASGSKTYQGHYTRLLQQLYCFLDTSQSASLRLQCLKLLVNLSLNADMVPHMLAAKAPSCLLDILDINYDVELLLRTVTFLANVMTIMQERNLSSSSLPPDEKAPSPETLYSALCALDRRDTLRNKVYRLTRHDSEDVCYQASRLYKCVVSAN
ncbi:dentin sialophosphoprotein-like [Littorina saxatilis]|uniref:Armadillo repeat-containing domain-containing protein n=1 Tax=Littorina saxatilis TaxID=31220 RepID=A0AAN9BD70_9CAEN